MDLLCKLNILLLLLLCRDGYAALRSSLRISAADAKSLKKAIGFNEDNYLTFQELTSKYKFPSEEHKVVTEDKYILTVFRILPKCNGSIKKYPVLMNHGMLDSSDTWIINGPKAGLGYILASNCYDVWLTNRRGNSYSREHVTLNPDTDEQYWEFSFDESANFDIPAVTDYILNITQKEKINFIGHSQGTTEFFAMTSLRPEINRKIEIAFALAPATWLKDLFNPFFRLMALRVKNIKQIFDDFGVRELFNHFSPIQLVSEVICQLAPGLTCGSVLYLATGSKPLISNRRLPIIFGHVPQGISTKALAHYGQLIQSKKFRRYDEGRKGNLRRYGTISPPNYNVSQCSIPVVLFVSKNDFIAAVTDVNYLSTKIPNVLKKYVIEHSQFGHVDYLWGDIAIKKVYAEIIKYLDKYN